MSLIKLIPEQGNDIEDMVSLAFRDKKATNKDVYFKYNYVDVKVGRHSSEADVWSEYNLNKPDEEDIINKLLEY